MSNPVTLFYSYARQDETLCQQLEHHLIPLKHAGRLKDWNRRDILAGGELMDTNKHLNTAQIILLLISSDFMATPYCYGEEMKRALERDKRGEARVIPILLRPVYLGKNIPFAHLKVLPANEVPVTGWKDTDEAFADITKELDRVLEDISQAAFESPQEKPAKDEIVEIVSPLPQPPSSEEEVLVELIETIQTNVFTIKTDPDYKVSFSVEPKDDAIANHGAEDLNIYIDDLNRTVRDMGSRIREYHSRSSSTQQERDLRFWRNNIKQEGQKLYRSLIQEHTDLKDAFEKKRQTVKPENLTLVFEGPRQDLSMPYEILYDHDTPLALTNPLCRFVNDAPPSPEQDFDTFVGKLQKRRSPLRVLLIGTGAQDTPQDQELTFLYGRITQQAQEAGIRPRIEIIRPYKTTTTYDRIAQQLRNNHYHIVHFVGQGTFDEHAGADAALSFKRNDQSEEQVKLTISELVSLSNKNEIRLFYLGNCVSIWPSNSDMQSDNGFYLGATDAIVRAGIPYVLGFRWHIEGEHSRLFADYFYERLLRPPFVPEQAVLYARQKMGESGETWTSPILVSQCPYGWTGKR